MGDVPLVIDVQLDQATWFERSIVVVVEPLYGVPAVSLALDAGWPSVELAQHEPGAAPIPLVSFEQRPSGDRCKVRSDDLFIAVGPSVRRAAPVLLGAPLFARPLAAQVANAAPLDRVTFVPTPAGGEDIAIDSWWAAGMLVRVLLDELDRESELTDAAGLAVMVAQGAEDPAAQLSAGARWREHLAWGGNADDLRVASAIDTVGIVPQVVLEGDSIIARPWQPAT